MKRFSYIMLAAAVAVFASCAKEQNPSVESAAPIMVQKTFSADLVATRTSLENGKYVYWTEGDKISVFDNVSMKNNVFAASNINGSGAEFTGYVADGASEYVAVFPYRFGNTYATSPTKVTATFPQIQKAVTNGFDTDVNLSVAISDGEKLLFRNVCALMKITIPEGVTNVRTISLANESARMSGKMSVQFDSEGAFTVTGDGNDTNSSREVSLDNGGKAMAPGDYYIVVMPGTYKKMFMAVTTTDNELYVKYATKEGVVIESNQIIDFGDVPAAGSKNFRLTNLPAGPVSMIGSYKLGYEAAEDYLKKLEFQNKQTNVISSVPSAQNPVTSATGEIEIVFNKRPGPGIVDVMYDGVRYPVLFDVRPWYKDAPDTWNIATTGAVKELKTSEKNESYIEVTTTTGGRGDVVRNAKIWVSPTMSPILCIRVDDPNDMENTTGRLTLDFKDNFKFNNVNFTGAVGNNFNKWNHKYALSDGSSVLVWNIDDLTIGTKELPVDFLADGNIQLKYADVKVNGAADQVKYRFFWFRSYGSLADLESYLADWSQETGLTYEKVK